MSDCLSTPRCHADEAELHSIDSEFNNVVAAMVHGGFSSALAKRLRALEAPQT